MSTGRRLQLIFGLSAVCAGIALAQQPLGKPSFDPHHTPLPTLTQTPGLPAHAPAALGPAAQAPAHRAAAVPAAAPAGVTSAPCPDPSASLCGYLPVPLDRDHPLGATISIYFEVYPHTNAGPAQSAILANFGGPGLTTTGLRGFAQFLFAANMDVHDLLLVDARGSGQSQAIDCSALQHGTAPFVPAEEQCAAQLGSAASRYGSGDVAKDMDAVRAALGYDKVDYFGASYGGANVTAYATRFGSHLRSAVLDAPLGQPAIDEFVRLRYRTHSDPRMVRLDCSRSALCAPDHPYPTLTLTELIQQIREHPIDGDSHDASGNPVHVHMDENALLNFVVTYPIGVFTNTGEILAAADALEHGDNAPLLPLGAEGFFPLIGEFGDPTFDSAGSFYATGCSDAGEPWSWRDSYELREEDSQQAIAALPDDYFAPFSKSAPTGILFSTLGKQCLWWQEPTSPSPMVRPGATYPQAPALVLDGDLDNRYPLEETAAVAALFPHGTFIKVPAAGHITVDFSQCAQTLVSRFIETLQAGDTSCAQTPEVVWPAVGRFPLLVRDARPAAVDPAGTNGIGTAERKTVSVAVATAIDALQRSLFGSGNGVGLRGGTFASTFGSSITTTLTNAAFTSDVNVNGSIVWGADNSLVGDLVVSGTGTAGGTLHIDGFWLSPPPTGNFKVTGTLGGQPVAVLVPEA